MKPNTPSTDEFQAHLQHAIHDVATARDFRERLFEPGSACATCRITDTWLLVLGCKTPICYECDARRRGLSGIEMHHIGGPGGIPVFLGANRHRLHDRYQDVVEQLGLDPTSRVVIELVLFCCLEHRLSRRVES